MLLDVGNLKYQAVLLAGTILDVTVQSIDPGTGLTAAATTHQTAG